DPEVRNAKALVMTPDSVIRADATQTGNGGKAILWSDEYTGFYGEILARGGLQGGDGGFVETSSKGNLQALGQADVSAFLGRGGTWLLDPPDVYITTTEANIGTTFGVNSVTFVPLAQNSQVSVDRILYALNNNQDVIIQAGPATKTLFSGLGEVGNGKGDITVSVPIVADLNSTGSLTMNNNWIMSGTSGYGNILIGAKVVVGGNLTLSAADDRGLPQLPNFPTRSDGGQGGKITINAPLYAKGVVSITAGQSIATNSGGTGGSIEVSANIYAGSGLSLIGGDADKGWNTGTAGVPPAFLITPYLIQVPNGTGTGAAIRASGGTAGTVTIQSGVSIYLGNGSSTIRAGTAGNNQQGGSLTIGSSILALGNSVDLTLASGLGLSSGTLSLASTLGVSGVQVDLQSIFGVNNAPTLTSSILNSLTLKSGNQVTVSAPANATT
ncbi:MAG: hypothetical protein EB090_07020, partial [Verrucomicrobia bacterium]|nr:hypothetical protein [Verrucomicrobiota bacterium]